MSKRIWAGLIIFLILIAGLWSWPFSEPQPITESTSLSNAQPLTEQKPSTDDNALAAASTDLPVANKRVNNKPIIKIGAIFPLTGSLAEQGNAFKNVLLLTQSDIKFQDPKYDYQFVIDDDGFDNKRTATIYQKQKSLDQVNAIISFGLPSANVIAPQAEKDKLIYMNFGASDKKIAEGKYNFINWTMPELTAERMLEFYQEHHYKNIVFIGSRNAGFVAQEAALQQMAKKYDIKITSFWFLPEEKDFRLLLLKTKELNADAYLVQIWDDQLAPFVKQYKEAGITALLTDIEAFSMATNFNILEGAYFSDAAQSTVTFNNRIKNAYPGTKSEYALGSIYDSVMMLVQAFENAQTPEQAVDELAKIKEYDGVVGLLTQDDEGIFNSRAVLKRVINGRPEVTFDEKSHQHGPIKEE